MIRRSHILIALLLAAGTVRTASAEVRPTVKEIELYRSGGEVLCDIGTGGLFSSKITRTLKSGLPAVVELFYYVVENGRTTPGRGRRSWSLEYDVWEDSYSVVSGDSVITHDRFDSMAGMMENLRGISLFPKGTFQEGSRYSVSFCVSVNPLSGRSGQQLEGWVEDNVRRGGEGWKQQVLSINDMISYFFKRDGDRTAKSEWYATGSFRLSDLPGGDE